jgi:hypothetical protein
LAVEKAFLKRLRALKGITEPTYEEERKKRRRSGNQKAVPSTAPMAAEEVEEQFDE